MRRLGSYASVQIISRPVRPAGNNLQNPIQLRPEAMVEEWIDSLLFTEFPKLARTAEKLGLSRTPLAAWVLKNSEGRGIRVDAVEVSADQHGTHTVGMRGTWGKDPTSLAVNIGSLDANGSFEQSFDFS